MRLSLAVTLRHPGDGRRRPDRRGVGPAAALGRHRSEPRGIFGPVAWGSTETQAKERAVEACEKVSKTCANGPATTNDMDDVFAVMCCSRPKLGCAAAAAESREDASTSVRKNLTEAGYQQLHAAALYVGRQRQEAVSEQSD